MGVLGPKGRQEVHEEGTVEILAELVQDEPISEAAVVEIVLDLDDLVGPPEVAVHTKVDQLKSDDRRSGIKVRN